MINRDLAKAVLVVGLSVGMASCGSFLKSPDRSELINKAVVLENVRAINARDVSAIRATLAPNVTRTSQATPGTIVENADEFVAFQQADWETFPDSSISIDMILAEGDWVAIAGAYKGTHRGLLGAIAPTGLPVSLEFAGFFRLEAEKIAEIHVYWDNVAVFSQLGLMPDMDVTDHSE